MEKWIVAGGLVNYSIPRQIYKARQISYSLNLPRLIFLISSFRLPEER
jgi:hypothetical protein